MGEDRNRDGLGVTVDPVALHDHGGTRAIRIREGSNRDTRKSERHPLRFRNRDVVLRHVDIAAADDRNRMPHVAERISPDPHGRVRIQNDFEADPVMKRVIFDHVPTGEGGGAFLRLALRRLPDTEREGE